MKKLVISGLLSCSLLLSGLIGGHKTEAASMGDTVTNIALDYLGVPYVWGGTSPNGFDCSGFTSYTYKQAGVSLPRSAADQFSQGQAVSKGNLVKGDLVFFSTYKAGASHVGISLGGDKFVHASTSTGVKISSLSEAYYTNTYIGSKRIGNYNNGWVLSGGNWYYYKNSVKQTGWLKDNSHWYYLAETDGAMKKGWLLDGDNWYYLNSNGAMLTGWVYSGEKWYFFYNDGTMAKDTTIGDYALDSNGAWIQ
ncbi:hypothetical protein BACCIP111895_04081 [Neobacillus rhizosphaerae]|uniref:NlpC/P60 domain-containing protein n=1 Tax=Neobacillus rhizosphaerae TaxID=2880965 RepID=A0ABN8KX35_9BACI|nr:C40 family peptidase [Neobacillus rhizosphaerae]CAH2716893.1 hypothetical protein BACCIP111895_04081 [Neobacillus rhizosphaerae]